MKINFKKALLTSTAFMAVSTFGISQASACAGGTPGATPAVTGSIGATSGAAGSGSVDGSAGCKGGDGVDFGASAITVTGTGAFTGGAGDVGAIAAGAGNAGGIGGVGTSFGTFTGDTLINPNAVTGGAGGAGSTAAGAFTGGAGGVGGNGLYDNTSGNTMTMGAVTGGAGGAGGANGGTGIGGAGANGGLGVDITTTGTGAVFTSSGVVTGGKGGAGGTSASAGSAAATNGGAGGAAILDHANSSSVSGVTFTGGAGGAGGANSGGGIGGAGAVGGAGADMSGTAVSFSASGTVTGGLGGAGGSGGAAVNSVGGAGGAGLTDNGTGGSTATASVLVGGKGGAGGAGTGAASTGGAGAGGGDAADIGGTTSFSVSGNMTGGQGGAGGASNGAVANSNGGKGGAGLNVTGTGNVITVGVASTLLGGAGGAAGAGGSGAAGLAGGIGDGLDLGGTGTVLINHGTINGQTAIGVDLTHAGALTSMTNDGTITSANVTAGQGTFVFGADDGSSGVTLNGLIQNTAANNNAVALEITAAQSGVITNAGTLLSNGTGAGLGVAVNFANDASLTNTGTITGQITETGNHNVTFTNAGTMNGNIVLGSSGVSTVNLNSGTATGNLTTGSGADVVNFNGGALMGNIDLSGGSNIVNVNSSTSTGGTLLATGGMLTTNIASGSTLTLSSYLPVTSNILQTNLTSNGLNNTIGSIASTGSVLSLAGETVNVNIGTPTILATGASNAVILATGNAAETAASNPFAVTDNSLLYNFAVTPGSGASANSMLLTASIAPELLVNRNNAPVAQVFLSNLGGSTNPQIVQIQNNLLNATSDAQANDILASTLPTVDGATQRAAFNITDHVQRSVDDHIELLRPSGTTRGMASGDMAPGHSAWVQAYGQTANQGTRGDIAGYNSDAAGGIVGVDAKAMDDRALFGVAVNYGNTNVDSNNINSTKTSLNSYGISLYGNYDLTHGTFLNGQAGYGFNDIDSSRYNVGGPGGFMADSSYHSDQYSAKLLLGQDVGLGHGGKITPNVSAAYTRLNTASYTESGAGGADLAVNGNAINVLNLGIGADARWDVANADGSHLKPLLHAGYTYDAIGDTVQDTSAFTGGGGEFQTIGASPSRSTGDVGAGLTYTTANNIDLSANYDYQHNAEYNASTGWLRGTVHF